PIDSIGAILVLMIISIIPLLINRTEEKGVLLMYAKILILFIFGLAIYHLFYIKDNGKERLIKDLKIGIVIQFVIGILALLGMQWFIDLGLFSHTLMPRFYGSEQEYRLYNLTSSAFFQLSLFYLFLFHFLLAYDHQKHNLNPLFLFLLLCIGLISGRTFLLLSLISIIIYFKWRYLPALTAFSILILLLAIFIPEHKYVSHALEPLINLISGAGRISSSTDTLVNNHLFMPTLKQFIQGDGYYFQIDGHYYGMTDSGFLRQVLYGGGIYLLTCMLFTFYFIRKVALNWFNGSWRFIYSTFLILTICHIKADTYAFPGLMLVLLMFLSLFGKSGKQLSLWKGKQ
ncbi:hypothetical protein, partial [Rodentibacter caecimuris]